MLEAINLVFTKAEVERTKGAVPTGVEVKLNVDNITLRDDVSVTMDFTYTVSYLPEIGRVKIVGKAYCQDTADNIKRVMTEFKKNKTMPGDLGGAALNSININAAINSIFLIRPFNLAPPFMPPPIVPQAAKPPAPAPSSKPKGR